MVGENISMKLAEVNTLAAAKAQEALSNLINEEVKVSFFNVDILSLDELRQKLSTEEIITVVYIEVVGKVNSTFLLAFSKKDVLLLSDLLLKRELGSTQILSGLEESALKELGNIVVGNYLTVMSNLLNVKFIEKIPNINSATTFGTIIDTIFSNFKSKSEEAVLTEIVFTFQTQSVKGQFLLFTKTTQLHELLSKNVKV